MLSGGDLDWICKASWLVQELSFHRAGCVWPGMRGEVGSTSLTQPNPSVTSPYHAVNPIPSSHNKLPWESALHTSVFLSAEPQQQKPYCQHKVVWGETEPSPPRGWAGGTAPSGAVLLEEGCCRCLSLCRKTYQFFIYLCLKGKKKCCWKNAYFNIHWDFFF